MLKEIWQYKDLLLMLTLREIRIRYKQASLGFIWAIFMPIMAISAGILVRKAMSFISNTPISLTSILSISIKVLPWTFFVNSLKFCVHSLIGDRYLITKIYFPREVIPFAYILASLFDFLIASVVLSLILIFTHISISIHILWVPLILLFLIFFTTGLGMIFASANLFLRDVKYLVEIILMFGIFFTPVFYDVDMFGKWRTLLLSNPIGSMFEALNNAVILHKAPDIFWFYYAAICSILMLVSGVFIFHKSEPYFAENI